MCRWNSLAASCLLLLAAGTARAENWPAWRGPRGDSTSAETNLPVTWSATTNVAWKAEIPASGASTPAIWNDAVFLTGQEGESLVALRLDATSGRIVWRREIGRGTTPRGKAERGRQVFHDLQNLASPSPVTDGQTVVVHFGNGDLAALDFDGQVLWRRNLQEDFGNYTIWWGHANSPLLFDKLVISVCMQDSLADERATPAESYVVAHDLRTGKVKWRTPRMTGAPGEQADAYTTPVLAQVDGQALLLVMGGNQLDAYDPRSGQRRWYLPGLVGGRTVTGPTVAGNVVLVTQGMRGALQAVPLAGQGKRSNGEVLWRYDQGTPDTPCPVAVGELVFTVGDDGVARALDLETGRLRWKQRLPGDFKATPLVADGKLYFLNTSGTCTVVAPTARFQKLAENSLPERTLASPAVSDGRIFLRGGNSLYCIGNPRGETPP